jgi:hypothetical protein
MLREPGETMHGMVAAGGIEPTPEGIDEPPEDEE